jgi:hypothetical protein
MGAPRAGGVDRNSGSADIEPFSAGAVAVPLPASQS